MKRPAALAIDGGGSKVDAVLLDRGGHVLGAARVGDPKHHETGDELHMDSLEAAVEAAGADARLDTTERPVAELGVYCLAGADLPADDRRILRGLAAREPRATEAPRRGSRGRASGIGGTSCDDDRR